MVVFPLAFRESRERDRGKKKRLLLVLPADLHGSIGGWCWSAEAMSKRKPKLYSLPLVLSELQGTPVVVETTKDEVIKGTLESCDEGMNLFLVNSTSEHVPTGSARTLENVCVRDRNVRLVVLPGDFDPVQHLLDADKHARRNQELVSRRRKLMTRKQLKIREKEAAAAERG